jgi:hypothetical protein
MATQQMARRLGGQPTVAGWRMAVGFGLAVLGAVLLALVFTRPQAAAGTAQPVIGSSAVVTASAWDGTGYRSKPIIVGAPQAAQPTVGQSLAVTALVWQGKLYQALLVHIGKPQGSGYTVTAPVWDGTRYHTRPVVVGGR